MAKVLIVDDDEGDRLIAQAILARAGHETFFAHDGEEALRQHAFGASSTHFDGHLRGNITPIGHN